MKKLRRLQQNKNWNFIMNEKNVNENMYFSPVWKCGPAYILPTKMKKILKLSNCLWI